MEQEKQPETNNVTNAPETPENVASTPTPPAPGEPKEHSSALGPILGVLIIILVLVLGGLYLWGGALVNERDDMMDDDEMMDGMHDQDENSVEADIEALGNVNQSDELEAIEEDLDNTLLELDQELDDIDDLLEEEPQVQ